MGCGDTPLSALRFRFVHSTYTMPTWYINQCVDMWLAGQNSWGGVSGGEVRWGGVVW